MRVEASKTSFLWFVKEGDKIVKVFHSREEAMEWLVERINNEF